MRLQIGFTGTQTGMNGVQREYLRSTLLNLKQQGYEYVHHGDCIGADAQFHDIARSLGFMVVVHPPSDNKKRARCFDAQTQVLAPKPYLDRNHDIVNASEIVLATPKELLEQQRSGTWATIRYAKKKKKQTHIFMPDGTGRHYNESR